MSAGQIARSYFKNLCDAIMNITIFIVPDLLAAMLIYAVIIYNKFAITEYSVTHFAVSPNFGPILMSCSSGVNRLACNMVLGSEMG